MKKLSLALSILLHVTLAVLALTFSRPATTRIRLDVPVYNVDLVTLNQPPPAPKAPPAPAPQPRATPAQPKPTERPMDIKPIPASKPAPSTAISPKKTDKAPPSPQPKPQEPTREQIMAEALKAAQAGAAKSQTPQIDPLQRELAELQKQVGSGPATPANSVGASTSQQIYAQDVVARIRPNWRYPLAGSNPTLTAVVELNLDADGSISSYRLVTRSGRADFDASVLKAVDETKLLSPPPATLRTIQITFNLQDLLR